jgi:hypothetical protein
MELGREPCIVVAGADNQIPFTSLPPACGLRCGERLFSSVAWPLARNPITTGEISMKMTRVLGLAAIGAVLVLAAPAQQAQALSLANPATANAIQESSKVTTTEVRWHGHGHWHHHHRHW